jgi:hypothetical protein
MIKLMMEATITSETSVYLYTLHGAIHKKALTFIHAAVIT